MDSEKCAKCKYGEVIRKDRFGIYIGCSKVKGKWVVEINECKDIDCLYKNMKEEVE